MTRRQKFSQWLGFVFISTGLLLNEWVLAKLFSPDGVLNTSTRFDIAAFDLLCLAIGLYLWVRKDFIILVKLFCSFLILLCVLALAEVALSKQHGLLFCDNPNGTGSYRLKPNYVEGPLQINSFGMRWREVKPENLSGKKRIAFIGDSFTFGCCADTLDKSFVGLFDAQMKSKQVETLNFGVPGFGVADYYLLLKEEVLQFHPDVVCLMFFNGNDFRDTYLSIDHGLILGRNRQLFFNARIPRQYKGTRIQEITEYLTDRELYHLWIQALENFRKKRSGQKPQYLHPSPFKLDQRFMSYSFWSQTTYPRIANEARDMTLNFLERMAETCRQAKIQFLIVTIPDREQVYALAPKGKNYDIAYPQKYVADFAAAHEIPYLDLLPDLRNETLQSHADLYFVEDMHFNNEGHRLTAQLLVEFFDKLIVQ